jgi:hypothetical protein
MFEYRLHGYVLPVEGNSSLEQQVRNLPDMGLVKCRSSTVREVFCFTAVFEDLRVLGNQIVNGGSSSFVGDSKLQGRNYILSGSSCMENLVKHFDKSLGPRLKRAQRTEPGVDCPHFCFLKSVVSKESYRCNGENVFSIPLSGERTQYTMLLFSCDGMLLEILFIHAMSVCRIFGE